MKILSLNNWCFFSVADNHNNQKKSMAGQKRIYNNENCTPIIFFIQTWSERQSSAWWYIAVKSNPRGFLRENGGHCQVTRKEDVMLSMTFICTKLQNLISFNYSVSTKAWITTEDNYRFYPSGPVDLYNCKGDGWCMRVFVRVQSCVCTAYEHTHMNTDCLQTGQRWSTVFLCDYVSWKVKMKKCVFLVIGA